MYSQYGEENFLKSFFDIKLGGIVVDIGAADGVRFSNSRFLIESGWKGILVEPNPNNFKKLTQLYQNNKNVILENVGCGEISSKNNVFYIDKNDEHEQLSTFKTLQMQKCKKIYNCEFVSTEINVLKTSDLFKKYDMSVIEFMSVDTEDYDENVIEGINLNDVTIKLICIEHDTNKIKEKLITNGYEVVHKTVGNIFYAKK